VVAVGAASEDLQREVDLRRCQHAEPFEKAAADAPG
jgi:hypothetical protein